MRCRCCSLRMIGLVLLLLLCGGLASARAQGLYTDDVRHALTSMTAADWAHWQQRYDAARSAGGSFGVQSVEEFVKINTWYQAFADDGEARHEFTTARGDRIVCVDIRTQRSLLASGDDPDRLPAPPAIQRQPVRQPSSAWRVGSAGLDGSLDEFGRVRRCPGGSFPKLIPPIEQYYRFATLADVFRRLPGHSGPPPSVGNVSRSAGYDWSEADKYPYANYGLEAEFNLWQNYVQFPIEHSLAEVWNLGNYGGADMQSAEAGIYHSSYVTGNDDMTLFIYFTADNYVSTGCYNLDCPGFVQTDPSVVIGGAFENYSEYGGDQYSVKIGFIRSAEGDWWLYVNETAIGYYPFDLYDGGPLSVNGDVLMYGGEVYKYPATFDTLADMGSGRFSSEGYGYAAFIDNMVYYDLSLVERKAFDLKAYASTAAYWDIGDVHYSDDPDLSGTSMYYGGPGSTECNITSCSSGCCDGESNCQPGNDPAACGQNGDVCEVCADGATCVAGECQGGADDDTATDDDADDDADDDVTDDDTASSDDDTADDDSAGSKSGDDDGDSGCGC